MSDNQTEAPLNILEVLDGMTFPANLVEVVAYAEDHDASEEVMDQIQALPDRAYNSIHDVALHLGLIEHLPDEENLYSSLPSDEYFTADGRPLNTINEKL
jgi:hypothetical protein